MKKTFCVDTNVFLYDPTALFAFGDNDVVIPLIVLEEIDSQKNSRYDEAGKNARVTARLLDELRKIGDLTKGVKLHNGGTLRIVRSTKDLAGMPAEFDSDKNDNFIIATALELQAKSKNKNVRLITKDISMRIKCDIMGVPCDDYLKHRVTDKTDLIYRGVRVIHTAQSVLDEIQKNGKVELKDLGPDALSLLPNEFVVVKAEQSSILTKTVKGHLILLKDRGTIWGLKHKNKEQKFAIDALLDDDVKICTLIGRAGCGKTLLALAAGLQQVLEEKKFNKLIISRPIQPMGRDIGYLPGTKEEKMEPWIQPIVDNLEFLFSSMKNRGSFRMFFDNDIIEIEAMTYIRGRSIPNTYIIIDEAQNLTVHELKTVITRVGEGTKIVLTGDVEQTDNVQVDSVSNGLTYAIEKFKEYDLSAHITLIKGERSLLATLASEIL